MPIRIHHAGTEAESRRDGPTVVLFKPQVGKGKHAWSGISGTDKTKHDAVRQYPRNSDGPYAAKKIHRIFSIICACHWRSPITDDEGQHQIMANLTLV